MERDADLLLFGSGEDLFAQALQTCCQVQRAEQLDDAIRLLRTGSISHICVPNIDQLPTQLVLELGGLIEHLPGGLLVLDTRGEVLWASDKALDIAQSTESPVGKSLFDALAPTVIIGPEFSPINRALLDGEPVRTVLKTGDRTYMELTLSPVHPPGGRMTKWLLATIRDSSTETLRHQKHTAIVQAGLELADLNPEEIRELSQEDRVDLLRHRLMHYTQDILEFDNVEIRLLDPVTLRLSSLLALGVMPDAAERELFASRTGNGVTGFVAATGKSYLCPDTAEDPLYLKGVEGARSSLTVPLLLHEQVTGTFNVESSKVGNFSEADQQYLELFCREVAVALNTLNLLEVEKASAALEGTLKLLCEVASPVDSVLNDGVWLLGRLQGQDPEAAEKLRNILHQTRLVRSKIYEVGNQLSANCSIGVEDRHPLLRSRRVLVIDANDETLQTAHRLLAPFGCTVETAHSGVEGLQMASTLPYDIAIADIGLEDMKGFKIFSGLREIHQQLPIVLMMEFGYDGDHAFLRARGAGMKRGLLKPLQPHMLIRVIEEHLDGQGGS